MNDVLFDVQHLSKVYDLGFGIGKKDAQSHELYAVEEMSFTMIQGETLGVVGESGSGKSTMGRCLVGLEKPTEGTIRYKGQDITHLGKRELHAIRKEMQIVFQNPVSSFNPRKSVGESLREVAAFHGLSRERSAERIRDLLDFVHLGEETLQSRSNGLSGGQLQRLAIVRALIPNPSFILADEPVSALDVSVQAQILRLFDDLKRRLGVSTLFVSHDLTVVEHLCDRVIVMYLGAIVEMAPTRELFDRPLHPYTQSLLASRPREYPGQPVERFELNGEIAGAIGRARNCRFHTRCPVAVTGVCDQERPQLLEVSPGHWVSCILTDASRSIGDGFHVTHGVWKKRDEADINRLVPMRADD
ncbi:oligopeptide/dipeptide ABC transporter ATP-binding protein [Bifidobacterium subtile]|jgi:oligopeptide/dipeptide ABC transporter ATP-binding protein|uniref:oligopeptide/dipeptide ABC transporter ATP-binding protein n=1 Tax=Bifidobacterium subtile TaxID=77635 RepID=UPI002F357133